MSDFEVDAMEMVEIHVDAFFFSCLVCFCGSCTQQWMWLMSEDEQESFLSDFGLKCIDCYREMEDRRGKPMTLDQFLVKRNMK